MYRERAPVLKGDLTPLGQFQKHSQTILKITFHQMYIKQLWMQTYYCQEVYSINNFILFLIEERQTLGSLRFSFFLSLNIGV